MLTPSSGKGKEIADYLREALNIPPRVRWFEVRFAAGEPVTVRCEFFPVETSEPEEEPDGQPSYGGSLDD